MQLDKIKAKIISSQMLKPKRRATKHDILIIQDELWVLSRKSSNEEAALAKALRNNIERMNVFLICDSGDELVYSYEPTESLKLFFDAGWLAIDKG